MTQTAQLTTKLSVLGAGAWGTVLATLLCQQGHEVWLWARDEKHVQELRVNHENKKYVPGLKLPLGLRVSADLQGCTKGASALIWAIPTKGTHEVATQISDVPAIISCSKGLETGSFKTVSEQLARYLPNTIYAALSGPNLALEIAQGKPAAATLASNDLAFARQAQRWFNQKTFRVYSSNDLTGVEVAGAVKNIMALAAGMSDGLGLGENAKASLLTRGLAEMVRLGKQRGGKTETFYGLAGLGDMIATCSSTSSRNHRAGELFAQGSSLADVQQQQLTAEGIPTVKAVYDYSLKMGLDLPISTEVYRVIYEAKPPLEAINDLMGRESKLE